MKRNTLLGGLAAIIVLGYGVFYYWQQTHSRIPALPIVVILPVQVSGPPELDFLTDAFPASLSTQLTGIPGLEIKGPPTSIELAAVAGDYKKVAQAYDVNLLVSGELSAEGNQLQLDLHIVEPITHDVLWSGKFPGTRAEYLDLTHRAGEGLRRTLHPSSQATSALAVEGGADAELAYREGEHFLDAFNNRHESADFDASLVAFQRTLQLNPRSANAAANIARLYQMKIEATGSDPALSSQVGTWARRALEIDPKCGRAYFMLANVDPANRLPNALRAATYAPEFAPAHLDLTGVVGASSTLALAASRQARMIDPLNLYAPLAEAGYLNQLGRVTEAFSILDRYVVSIEPEMVYGRWAEASLMIELGWLERAEPFIKDIEKDVAQQRLMPLASNTIRQKLAVAQKEYGSAGLEVPRILAIVKNPNVSPLEISVAVESVPTLANTSYIDEAFEILARAVETGAILPYDTMQLDHRLEKMRKDGRFGIVINKSRAQFTELMKVLDDAKSRGELPPYLESAISDVKSQLLW
jgi:TolB-like protein